MILGETAGSALRESEGRRSAAEAEPCPRQSETRSAQSTMNALVAGMSHEIRNPLFGISATLDAFEARCQDRPEYRRYFEVLQGEVKRLSELMQQLLDYGKPLRLERAEVPAREVAAEAAFACLRDAQLARVEIVQEIEADPILWADRDRAVQALQGLVENAVQYSPRGGRVTLKVERAGESVRFTVEDDGPGIRRDDLPRLFEPFFTRRRGGTGLGLSVVQRIVEQHGGGIAAANRPGGGARMTVLLPAASAAPGERRA